ncbi:hypothetical protein Bca4012_021146 [Brassica carinata]
MDEEEVEVCDRASRGCSHTHSCNPPGPDDASHSHTCVHTQTRLHPCILHILLFTFYMISMNSQENDYSYRSNKRRSCGNREAVRKYREKKKAPTAYLEDETKRILQSQAVAETEIIRLLTLLIEMQVKIDHELGGFSFQKQCNGQMDPNTISISFNHADGCNVATRNEMCEVARVECDEGQAFHEPIHSIHYGHSHIKLFTCCIIGVYNTFHM